MTSNNSHFVLVVLKLSCYVKNSIALRIEDKLLVSNTVYKTLINVTVDFTPLRRHLRVNKDKRSYHLYCQFILFLKVAIKMQTRINLER